MDLNQSKVDTAIVEKYVQKLGLAPTDGSPEAHLKALTDYFATKPLTELVVCDRCHGQSTLELDECPFCGDAEIEEEAPKPKKAAKKKEKSPKAIEPTAEVKLSAKDFEKQAARVEGATRKAAGNLIEIGQALSEINDRDLWKLPKDPDTKLARYRSFKSCVQERFGMSLSYAYALMKVASEFTPEDLRKFGIGRLKLALSVPSEEREKVLAEPTVEGARQKAKEIAEPKPTPAPVKSITVAAVLNEIVEAVAQKRPNSPQAAGTPTSPAAALSDDPWAVFDLANDLRLFVRVRRNVDGEIVISTEFKHNEGSF